VSTLTTENVSFKTIRFTIMICIMRVLLFPVITITSLAPCYMFLCTSAPITNTLLHMEVSVIHRHGWGHYENIVLCHHCNAAYFMTEITKHTSRFLCLLYILKITVTCITTKLRLLGLMEWINYVRLEV